MIAWTRSGIIFACILLAVTGILTCGVPATAQANETIAPYANTVDTQFWFDLGDGYSTTAATTGRAKEDDTPLYFYPSVRYDIDMFYIYAQGSYSQSGGTWVGQTSGSHGAIYGPVQYSLRSFVYESDYPYARITAWMCSMPGHVSGYWSPDSMRTYTVCNVY